jgi:hypothetical protein
MMLVAAGVRTGIVLEGVARAHPDIAIREIDMRVERKVDVLMTPDVLARRSEMGRFLACSVDMLQHAGVAHLRPSCRRTGIH